MAALGTRLLTLTIDGVERDAEVSRAIITTAESDTDFVSFQMAAEGGGRDYILALTFVQDPGDVTSLWNQIWEHAGEEIAVVVRPYGNEVFTVSQPHFTGNVTVTVPDGDILGGEADASTTARWTTDVEWKFTEKPTKVTV